MVSSQPTKLNYVILVTVPHTGTNFFAKLFVDYGYDKIGPNAGDRIHTPPPRGVGWFTRCHVSPDALRLCREYSKRGATIVTTVRNLDDLRASWAARNRAGDLKRDLKLHRQLIKELKPFIVTFEKEEDRDFWLKKLTDHLGIELKPDWDVKVAEYKRG